MMAFQSMSYWDAYNLPIPIRKWLITRYNKYVAEAQKNNESASTERPLTEGERIKMINQAQKANPLKSQDFMRPIRNR